MVLHNYDVIISECQKVTLLGGNLSKHGIWSPLPTPTPLDFCAIESIVFTGLLGSMGGWPQRTRGSCRSHSARVQGALCDSTGLCHLALSQYTYDISLLINISFYIQ